MTNQDPSMEQILKTIRGVITEEEAPLELTEELKEENPEPSSSILSALDDHNKSANINILTDNQETTKSNLSNNDIDDIFENNSSQKQAPVSEKENTIDKIIKTNITKDDFDQNTPSSSIENNLESNIENNLAIESDISNQNIPDKTKNKLLISEKSAEDTSNTIKSFMKSVSKPTNDGLNYKANTTVEELIIQMIRPHLKEWLDKNLPTIVKQIVEKEINKLIPKDDD